MFTILFFSVLIRDYIWCSLLLYSRICGHATLGKPKRSRQTVDFMLTDENDGKQ